MNRNKSLSPKFSKRRTARRYPLFGILLIACLAIAIAGRGTDFLHWGASAEGPAAQESKVELSANALRQMETIATMKASLTPAQKKIDSQLIFATKQETGEMAALGLGSLQVDVQRDENSGKVLVDITADVSDAFIALLKAHGGEVVSAVPNLRSVRAEIALSQLEAIAAVDGVKFIQPAQEAATAQEPVTSSSDVVTRVGNATVRVNADLGARAAHVQEALAQALAAAPNVGPEAINPSQDTFPVSVNSGTGAVVSEGEKTHQVNRARGTFNVDGTGLKIGVLSNGVGGLSESQGRGELGPVTVLPGQFGPSGSEGTAMLEIVHDIAPGAQLYFATAFTGPAQFAQNIRDLRAAGCDIIVDDVFYFLETPFQDGQAPAVTSNTLGGVVAQAVNDVTTSGALYFSSAGNQGNINDNTAGVWEGDFNDGGVAPAVVGGAAAGNVHLFTPHPSQPAPPAPATNNQIVAAPSTAAPINLFWSDPLGASNNDYDLYVTNAAGTALQAASTNSQSGTQDPAEQVGSAVNVANNRVFIVKFAGAARYLHLNTNGGRTAFNTPGQTKGHSTAALAYGVAATPAIGPYPAAFSAANTVETFSSDGPRRLFFNADSTAITPGNFSATGGLVRQKPDITAADGVSVTGVAAFGNPFFGTSAAAPHAAAIAALLKQAAPAATQAQIRTALTSSAIDIEGAGVDRDSGAGIIDAFAALQASGAASFSNLELGTVTPAESGGNANGFIESGETGTLNIVLENTGLQNATGITATLTTSTPGVAITPSSARTFPNIAIGATGTNSSAYSFAIGGGCSPTIDFTLSIVSADRPSPKVINLTLFTGRGANISTSLDAVAAPSGTFFTGASGTQAGRLVRDGVEQNCGPNKSYPGVNDNSNRRFDSYTFPNTSSSASCVTVRLYAPAGISLQPVAYGGTFTPTPAGSFNTTSAASYLGDAGSTGVVKQFSARVPANTNLTVVINDVGTGVVAAVPYTLEVTGLNPPCAAVATVNQPPVNTVPAAQSVVQNSQLVFSTGNGNAISIADPDANGYPVQQTLTATNGTLTLGSTAGLSFSLGTGTNNSSMTFTGSIAAINTALQGLTYRPNTNFTGAATLTVNTNDQGFLGSGGAKTDNDVVNINVLAGSAFNFSSASYFVGESDGSVIVTVTRNGDLSGAASVNYATSNGTATDRSDYGATFGTLQFAAGQFSNTIVVLINDDSLVEGNESFNLALSNPVGTNVALGLQSTAIGTIVDNATEPATNAIDDTGKFVEQHYHDFLNRESDPAGFAFWVNNIEACGANAACREVKRIDTSASFFLSLEFQQTGFLSYRTYAAAFGPTRVGSTVPLTYQEFVTDTQQLGNGVIIGNAGAEAQLEANKVAYFNQFVTRPEFVAKYPGALTNAEYVDNLLATAGLSPSQVRLFVVNLTNNQEVPPTVPTLSGGGARPASFGIARFRFNDAQTAMTMTATINNIDVGNAQTPDTNDNLVNAHIHAGPTVAPGVNGPVVWGFFGAPFNDNNPNDATATPTVGGVGGTFTGKWDAPEGNGTTLAAQLANLREGRAYINFHTVQFGGGEIRGNFPAADAFRNSLVAGLNAGTETRATVLRKVAEAEELGLKESNRAFVLMQYFGYLRRNPNDAPDADFSGYNFWLNKLNTFNGDFRAAEMVKAFITSIEYRKRFGLN